MSLVYQLFQLPLIYMYCLFRPDCSAYEGQPIILQHNIEERFIDQSGSWTIEDALDSSSATHSTHGE